MFNTAVAETKEKEFIYSVSVLLIKIFLGLSESYCSNKRSLFQWIGYQWGHCMLLARRRYIFKYITYIYIYIYEFTFWGYCIECFWFSNVVFLLISIVQTCFWNNEIEKLRNLAVGSCPELSCWPNCWPKRCPIITYSIYRIGYWQFV